jgi:hypothetical protein
VIFIVYYSSMCISVDWFQSCVLLKSSGYSVGFIKGVGFFEC